MGGPLLQRIIAVFLALIVLFAVFAWTVQFVTTGGITSQVDSSTYQAVHLTGGQLYFGKVTSQFGAVVINDAYYFPNPAEGRPANQLVRHGT